MTSHAAVVINAAEEVLGELRVRACAARAERLLAWGDGLAARTWAVEGAAGMGRLLAQQLVSAGERCWMCSPSWVRLVVAGGPLAHRSGAFGLTIV